MRSPSALANNLPQYDADVFDGVVLIDVEVALGLQFQIEAAVLGEQLQHVIKKPDAGRDLVRALPVQLDRVRESASPW